ncbi:VOC family protein [Ferrigenium sp. UT5]|uniref:VOC family protein n=1 Tax=Ferrigenium sp. UT5 TaxID=3242105 RepID=UPI003553D0CC
MQIKALGHIVLKVGNLERSIAFYRDTLGMKEVARYRDAMAFFTLGDNHHDLGLMQLGANPPPADPGAVGLYHVAFKVGDSLDELRACKAHLEAHGVGIFGMSDHGVSQSLYIQDPDGIEIELYVDANPAIWRDDPGAVLTTRRLQI